MQIHDLTLHNVGFKVSHNSYEIKPFDPAAQYDANVRGFEIDISQYKTKSDWCVRHSPGCDSHSLPLSEYLKQIWEWHATGEGEDPKDPMVVYIDLKSGQWSHDDFAQRFDDYVMQCCPDPDRIFSPHQLMPGPSDLMQGAMALGWPTLAELRGQLIFCLSGDNPGKRKYSETNPPHRVCFADHETIMPTCCDSGTRVFINVSRVAHFADFPVFSRWLRSHRALIGRAYDIASKTDWKIMQEAGFNMLAVDEKYAMDGNSPAHPYWPIPW
jgi:hypothetical protein